MKSLLLALAFVLPLPQPSWSPAERATEDAGKSTLTLSFGVYQSDKATVMYKKLTPVLEYLQEDLEKRVGRPVDIHLSIFKSYDEGIAALVNGDIDFVRFGPASYITAKLSPIFQTLPLRTKPRNTIARNLIIRLQQKT